jgi:hypothetical protein
MKKVLAIVLAALIVACAAASAQSLLNARAEYEGFGLVELDLNQNVTWAEPQVEVTDAEGNTLDAQVYKYDRDDVDFWIPDLTDDQVYTGTLSGAENGETATFEFYASSVLSTMIRSVEYDAEDRELDIDFAMDVQYESPVVTVTDANGNVYEGRILERDNDSLEVRVKGLTRGSTYTVSVSGVKGRTFDTFETYTAEFVAIDD